MYSLTEDVPYLHTVKNHVKILTTNSDFMLIHILKFVSTVLPLIYFCYVYVTVCLIINLL